jgi:hypothetical protein
MVAPRIRKGRYNVKFNFKPSNSKTIKIPIKIVETNGR